ncbi:MAG: hypothetical protein ABSF23_00790 [Terracidiphilus sp.]|jgi:hypothetical protein
MVAAAQKFLDAFEALPQPAKHEVLDEILRRAALEHHGPPTDAELTAAADALFLQLDRDEERRPLG